MKDVKIEFKNLRKIYINYKGKKISVSILKVTHRNVNILPKYSFTYKHPTTQGLKIIDIKASSKEIAIKKFKRKMKNR